MEGWAAGGAAEAVRGSEITVGVVAGGAYDPVVVAARVRSISGKPRYCGTRARIFVL